MKQDKIIYMGTTVFAAYILEQLILNNYNIVALVSQPDRKVGRKREIKATPTKEIALKYDIKTISHENINEHVDDLKDLNPDLIITCAYGQKVSKDILSIPRLGSINVHASRLPLYRGGAPIHYAIINGEQYSGNTIMYMEESLDTGDMIAMSKVAIDEDDTTAILHDKLKIDGASLLLKTLPDILSDKVNAVAQDDKHASFAYNITPQQEFITFNRDVDVVYNHMRGLISVPGGFSLIDNKKIKFHEIRKEHREHNYEPGYIEVANSDYFKVYCENGFIKVFDFQLEGKRRVSFKDYINGNKLEIQTGIVLNEGV